MPLPYFDTLINPAQLSTHLGDLDWAIVDCRFSLDQPERGWRDYQQGHIPGSVYAHLNRDLSGKVVSGETGRHPLPDIDRFSATLSNWGIGPGVQVVAYDDWTPASGAIAARLWWMLRWLGHEAVAVLDGGWQRWLAEEQPVKGGEEGRPYRKFTPRPRPELLASTREVEALRQDPNYRLMDARSADRYRGENENIDPRAGHIPGAVSAPYAENASEGGRFLPPEALRERFECLLNGVPPERAIVYCGSGVTAAHNLLAMARAGLGEGRLYAGSWSEWITDPDRPAAIEE